ncbi:hypothetical protein, partial [Mycobacterium avium]|uniref:hypothetical protein n=1 Tax=Mycobacterium avium TaxID=1764 RepID=UPI001F472185
GLIRARRRRFALVAERHRRALLAETPSPSWGCNLSGGSRPAAVAGIHAWDTKGDNRVAPAPAAHARFRPALRKLVVGAPPPPGVI